ncbi:MAG: nitroreductase family protein [Candidatus Hinthialibacter antarcticus]|nr:nitroreductase family protein [Candidatus Hinthialibacter antarcticus]
MSLREFRTAEFPVHDIFINRNSPRAMSGEAISDNELMSLFEAARWASSCYNEQPWRFVYAMRGSQPFQRFMNCLVEFNQTWCNNAAALIVLVSQDTFALNNNPNDWHSFDSGSAWQSLALQGSVNGLVVHGMAGFDKEKAAAAVNLPGGHSVEIMIAVGKPGPIDVLPQDMQKGETPSQRKPMKEIALEGSF